MLLKVSGKSDAPKLASAISHAIYEGKEVFIRAIGAGAVNQTCKAMAIAQGYVGPRGLSLTFRPAFTIIQMDDGEVTGLVFQVFY
ncbi:stage V sporulation protein S [Herbidospora galbida]|uniref:Stage V sporulation protein S n=2 Tax=Herbidospora galbida TaxID=2575442 RepID=A0A4U3M8R0_9ACTN|nr:stage V sporulation protein S [Herbidospora galbida]